MPGTMTKYNQKKKIPPPKREGSPKEVKRVKKVKKIEKDSARKKQSDDQQELASIWDEDLCE
jgi:hypothetical protein